jgi:hypothetical protein
MFPLAILAAFLAAAAMPVAVAVFTAREAPVVWVRHPDAPERFEVVRPPRSKCVANDPMPRFGVDTVLTEFRVDDKGKPKGWGGAPAARRLDSTRVYTLRVYKAPMCGESR